MRSIRRLAAALPALVLVVAACGDDVPAGGDGLPTVVVTTSILGDVVDTLVDGRAEVVTIMPVGANPHTFQASARQAATMVDADALVVNGGGFEEGLLPVVDNAAAEGVPVHEAISAVDPLERPNGDDHGDEDGPDDDRHAHGPVDPHFFTDAARMAQAVAGIADHLRAAVPDLDDDAFRATTDTLVADLQSLDAEVADVLAAVPDERRRLVTDHQVFDSFAERYGFEVVGTVVPGGSADGGVSGGQLAALARDVRRTGTPAIFTSATASSELARTLAEEVGGIEVVALFAESLGPPGSGGETYRAMMLTNARRIAAALGD